MAALSLKFPDLCNAEEKCPDSPNPRHRSNTLEEAVCQEMFRINFSVIDALSTNLIGEGIFLFSPCAYVRSELNCPVRSADDWLFSPRIRVAAHLLQGAPPLLRFIPGGKVPAKHQSSNAPGSVDRLFTSFHTAIIPFPSTLPWIHMVLGFTILIHMSDADN